MIVALSVAVLVVLALAVLLLRTSRHATLHLADLAQQSARTTAELEGRITHLSSQLAAADQRAESLDASRTALDRTTVELRAALERMQEQAQALGLQVAELSQQGDPMVLWALERSRSERTWRHSVSSNPEDPYVPLGPGPLAAVLKVEVDATREEVGTAVDLDLLLPDDVSATGCLLILRVAQELLASVVHRSETCVLRVHGDGNDALIGVTAHDEHGMVVPFQPLPLPASGAVITTDAGYRVRAVRLGTDPAQAVAP